MTARFNGLPLALCLLLGGPALAEELPKSPACRTALKSLNDAEDTLAASAAASSATAFDQQRQRAIATRLQPLRKQVADACLGGLTTSPSPSQRTWVAPTLPARPSTAAPRVQPPQPAVIASIPRPQAPVTVNHCNAAVCVTSDGSTLTRVGPNLVGPRGTCTVQGGFLRCP